MKKSHLIFLLCLLFCGQMFAQRPTPSNPKNPNAPVIADTTGEPPTEPSDPCEGISYEIKIDSVVWGANYDNLINITDPMDGILETYPNDFPELFNVAIVSLKHPGIPFKEYTFDISAEQFASSNPIVIIFPSESGIDVIPILDTVAGVIKGFTIKRTSSIDNNITGVITAASVEARIGGGTQCISVFTKETTITLADDSICPLDDSTSNCMN